MGHDSIGVELAAVIVVVAFWQTRGGPRYDDNAVDDDGGASRMQGIRASSAADPGSRHLVKFGLRVSIFGFRVPSLQGS